ncbi:MAG: DUF2254 domain-containing protein [Verrucomicrobia bacterium]|nr:DUF2254 domain-containing protein [Verrucomicrobiota bacterium]
MKKLRKLWISLRSSLWFIPSIMVILASGLALLLIDVDTRVEADLAEKWPRIFGVGAEGARGILEAIAGSMITVTGVVFSVVIVALSLASNQYTPRILRNFMRDKGTQIVLGVFVSVFTYCLIVMRTIRGGDDDFVPGIATGTSILLALTSIGFLIYFIHHIAEGIQASSIISTITRETIAAIENVFPEKPPTELRLDEEPPEQATVINCKANGYLQTIAPGLKEFAEKHRVILRIENHIGEFIIETTPLVSVLGTNQLNPKRTEELEEFFVIAEFRTIEQDPGYGIRQLVDIALKALSPSINDNATAANCIEHLGAILSNLVPREDPSRIEAKDGKPLVIGCPVNAKALIDKALLEIRQSARGNASIVLHMLKIIDTVLNSAKKDTYKHALLHHIDLLEELAVQSIESNLDRHAVSERITELRTRHAASSLTTN